MAKRLFRNFLFWAALVSAAFVLGLAIASGSRNHSHKHSLSIEKTANVVEKIRQIARFNTASYYEELVVTRRKANQHVDNAVGNRIADFLSVRDGLITDELCMIAKGTVRAGYDLSSIEEDAIRTSGDTLFVRLPVAMVLDVQLNPSDCEMYVCDGQWSDSEMASVQREAKNRLYSNALDSGILDAARNSGERQLENLFSSFGFGTVVLE